MKRTLSDWLSWQETLHLTEIDLGLERIGKVAHKLKLLKPDFPIITVAGTNGKGSSVALLEAILIAQGYNVGSYTSPHLIDYNERIKINAQNANEQQIIDAFEVIDKARGNISLTYFEFSTLAAILCFSQQNIDVAILEVGLGGRLDAANLWDTSLAIISSIDIDHENWLGNDRETIGIEKSGIMRKDTPVICGDPHPPKSIAKQAGKIGAKLYQLDKDFFIETDDATPNRWKWVGQNKTINLPKPNLKGRFQLNNAATVIAGLYSLKEKLPVDTDAIKQGLLSAKATGRLQIISQQPEWLLDVAHNPQAAKALAAYLANNPVSGKTYALFSMLKDKDIKQVVSIMSPAIDEWHIVPLGGTRGMTINELNQALSDQIGEAELIPHNDFKSTYQSLKNISNFKDRVVVFGSFLVVSEILQISEAEKTGLNEFSS